MEHVKITVGTSRGYYEGGAPPPGAARPAAARAGEQGEGVPGRAQRVGAGKGVEATLAKGFRTSENSWEGQLRNRSESEAQVYGPNSRNQTYEN